MKIQAFTLNAFAKTEKGGNPAGVVLNADNLSKEQMLVIAKKINFPETAFVQKSKKADFKVRFFTPEKEVDLCGHATVATFSLMKQLSLLPAGSYTQETKAGILNITITADDMIYMQQNIPQFLKKLDKTEVAEALNITENKIIPDLPVQIVSTGFPTILVPVTSLEVLESIRPALKKSAKLCQKEFLLHVFTLETKESSSVAHSRNFFPIKILDEEAATGTATGALACYLWKYKLIKSDKIKNMVFEQGYVINRPSHIMATLKTKNENIEHVEIYGGAILEEKKEIVI